jgi:hypothetical protein
MQIKCLSFSFCEYNIAIEDDVVTFTRKVPVKENQVPEPLTKPISANKQRLSAKPKITIEQFVQDNPALTRGKTTQEVLNLMAGRK